MSTLVAALLLSIACAFLRSTPQSEPPLDVETKRDAASSEALRRNPRDLVHAPERNPRAPEPADVESDASRPEMREAVAAIRERDLPRALASLYRVLDARPDYPPALYEMGVVYFRLQRYGDGAAVLERYLAVAPDRIGHTRALGHCYYSLGDYARAKAPTFGFVLHRELSIPRGDNSADIVCAFSLFTHLLQAETYIYLEECARILKPNGRIVFSFMEFAEPAHWNVFVQTMNVTRAASADHLDMFIERNAIGVWAANLGLIVDIYISAGCPIWNGHALGQSIAVLRKPG